MISAPLVIEGGVGRRREVVGHERLIAVPFLLQEGAKYDQVDLVMMLLEPEACSVEGNLGGSGERIAVNARGHATEGDGADRGSSMGHGRGTINEVEASVVARGEGRLVLANRAHGVQHESRRQTIATRNLGLTRLATIQCQTLFVEVIACGIVDRSIDTTATKKRSVRRVHNRIHIQACNWSDPAKASQNCYEN